MGKSFEEVERLSGLPTGKLMREGRGFALTTLSVENLFTHMRGGDTHPNSKRLRMSARASLIRVD